MLQPMSPPVMPRPLAMSGRATLTAVMSRMTISCATHSTSSSCLRARMLGFAAAAWGLVVVMADLAPSGASAPLVEVGFCMPSSLPAEPAGDIRAPP